MLDDTMHVDDKSSAEQLGGETAAPQSYPRPTLSSCKDPIQITLLGFTNPTPPGIRGKSMR